MNKVLEYNVTGQNIELASPAMLVAGTVNEYTARFSFGADWEGYQRVAVFNADGTEREQLLTDDTCKVPWEVLLPGAYLKVGVYGTRDGSRLPTIWTSHRQYIHDGAGPTDEAADPSPVLAEQILQRMGDLGDLKTEDKSSLVAAINEVKETGGGGGTADHSKLKNRDAADQHPMSAITGLEAALEGKQPTGNYLTDKDLDATLTVEGKAADAKAVGDALSTLSEEIVTTSESKVSAHNTGTTSHSDIRLLIQGLTDRLNALADSDDATLDQLSEIVAYIKSNKSLIDAITTSKVNVSDIVDNLTTNVTNKPLSAAQGVALKSLIDAITIPEALPNPNALTFTGAVTGSYDGSEPLTVNIPSSGGGSGGSGAYDVLYETTLGEAAIAQIPYDETFAGKSDFILELAVPKGEADASFTRFTTMCGRYDLLNNTKGVSATFGRRFVVFMSKYSDGNSVMTAYIADTTSATPGLNVAARTGYTIALQAINPTSLNGQYMLNTTISMPAGTIIRISGR